MFTEQQLISIAKYAILYGYEKTEKFFFVSKATIAKAVKLLDEIEPNFKIQSKISSFFPQVDNNLVKKDQQLDNKINNDLLDAKKRSQLSQTFRSTSKEEKIQDYDKYREKLGKGWVMQKNTDYYKNRELNMIWGKRDKKDKILEREEITDSFEILAKNYDREKFLHKIETHHSNIVIYLKNNFYNFIHIGIACKILEDHIELMINNANQLLCQNESFFFIINTL